MYALACESSPGCEERKVLCAACRKSDKDTHGTPQQPERLALLEDMRDPNLRICDYPERDQAARDRDEGGRRPRGHHEVG
jgi:hypothetical protein